MPAITAQSSGPPCAVGGNPDDKLCVSSDQDNVAPLGESWLTAVRYNASLNWSIRYGAWIANVSALAIFSNVRAVGIDMNLDSTLHDILNHTTAHGHDFRMDLEADTPYIVFTIKHVGMPMSVTWRGDNVPFSYDAPIDGGTLRFTLTFSNGALVVSFPSTKGSTGESLPVLSGLTNFPQFNLIPDIGQVVTLSCDRVTLQDPRPTSEIADTRVWLFDWGDGGPLTRTTTPEASHLYGSPGVYGVVMTVQTVDGTVIGYAGRVDTTVGACVFHVARSLGFVLLTGAFIILLAVSLVVPRFTKQQRKALRRKAAYCLIVVFILVVIL